MFHNFSFLPASPVHQHPVQKSSYRAPSGFKSDKSLFQLLQLTGSIEYIYSAVIIKKQKRHHENAVFLIITFHFPAGSSAVNIYDR